MGEGRELESGAAPDTTDDLGEIVGGYRLEERIASGGMGHVYAATHLRLSRRAAVKVLNSKFVNDESVLSRFYHEARIANEVRHPNIIDIFDFVELEEPRRVACIMELLEGPSLRQRLKQGKLSVTQAVNVTLQLGGALSAVHQKGVIHRDLKPDNVVLTGRLEGDLSEVPSVKLLDFGIAKSQEALQTHKTGTGMVLGTPAYMAPEQIAGEPIGTFTDVYALGEILFEMLAGERMFPGKAMEVFRRKLSALEPDCILPGETPSGQFLSGIIRRCIRMEAGRRISLVELLEVLGPLGGPAEAGGVISSSDPLTQVVEPPETPTEPGTVEPPLPTEVLSSPEAIMASPPTADLRARAGRYTADLEGRVLAAEGPPPAPSQALGPSLFDQPPDRSPSRATHGGVHPPAPLPLPLRPGSRRRPWRLVLLGAALTLAFWVSPSFRSLCRWPIERLAEALRTSPEEAVQLSTSDRAAARARLEAITARVGGAAAAASPELLLVAARKAWRADRSRDNAEALEDLTQALAARPEEAALLAEWARGLAIARGEALSAADAQDAEALLALATELSPGLPLVDAARAEFALGVGDNRRAAKLAAAALEKMPEQGAIRITLADGLATLNPERALAELALGSQTEVDHRRADRITARALAELGRYHGALDVLQRRLRADPRNAAVLRLYGDLERELGNDAKAVARYEAAASGEGERLGPRLAAGWTYLALGNSSKAEESFLAVAQAVGGAPRLVEQARVGLVRTALAREERFVGAQLKEALAAGTAPESRLALAELAAAGGAYSVAEGLAQPLVQHPLAAPAAQLLLAKAAAARADAAAAGQLQEAALGLDLDDPELRVVVAAAHLEAKDPEGAVARLQAATPRDPGDRRWPLRQERFPVPRFLVAEARQRWEAATHDPRLASTAESALALLSQARGESAEAKQHAQRALKLDPTGAQLARAILIQTALAAGAPGEALLRAGEWARLEPQQAGGHLGRARALAAKGQRSQALEAYSAALAVDPGLGLGALERRALEPNVAKETLASLFAEALRDRSDWRGARRLAFALGL